ncbi:MAG: winged helix-turn-helix transcriptional regulator [Micromonosporaceae bacterium]|nr:winged helix-turn-helix transcriptional regulator [Micromonosporaceae bacterium]
MAVVSEATVTSKSRRAKPAGVEVRPPEPAGAAEPAGLGSHELGWALGVLLRSHRDLVSRVLGDFPHGPRGYQTLAEVMRGEQPSQLALANRLGIDRTVMTYLIDDLVAAGLVERRPNPTDRRQRQIVATPKGEAALASLCDQVTEAENAMLGALDDDERELFRRLVLKAAHGVGSVDHSGDACTIIEDALRD